MDLIQTTALWKSSLGRTDHHPSTSRFVTRLQQSFILFRDHALQFAKQLPQDLRQLTVHDETHTDALWEVFDVLFPAEIISNPLEAYILVGAFLIHDLGHALCMYPGGLDELKRTTAWKRSEQMAIRLPGNFQSILENAIRLNHAAHSERLALTSFGDGLYLIDDAELRNYLGSTIGKVAYSHWWDHKRLDASPDLHKLGAVPLADCPSSWTMDPRKLCYILRACDACQIDGRRAPIFVESLRKPKGVASHHWGAQRHLAKPYESKGEIHFTSLSPFNSNSLTAWWTAYDLAQLAETELKEADRYFFNHSIRPKVTRVAGSSSPRLFAMHVKTEGWEPVETRPTITAVTEVIRRLGGSELYGADLLVPLREMIQNSRDAIVAKRATEQRSNTWGTITVTATTTDSTDVLTVADNGIGMSERTITKYLLNFGTSYWNSSDCLEDLDSLNFEQFNPIGQFGIGFFSVFMLGSRVKVISRTANDGISQTRVLDFRNGLDERPILRVATPQEQLYDSGTTIKIELSDKDILKRILTPKQERNDELRWNNNITYRHKWTLAEALAWECPAADVDITAIEDGVEQRAIVANDWTSLKPEQLFRRLFSHREDIDSVLKTSRSAYHIASMENLEEPSGRLLGRASLIDNTTPLRDSSGLHGIVTCGPFRSSIELRTPGILIGKPVSASRNESQPLAFENHMVSSPWATLQAKHANESNYFKDLDSRSGLAAYVRSLCGNMFNLKVYHSKGSEVSLNELIYSKLDFEEVLLFPYEPVSSWYTGDFDFNNPSHIGVTMGRMTNGKLLRSDDPLERSHHPRWRQYWYSLWGAAIEAISIAWNCELTELLNAATNVNAVEDKDFNNPAIIYRPK